MKVLAFLLRCDLQRRVEKALSSARFVVEKVASANECSKFARFAPYDGVLVDADSLVFAQTLLPMKQLRQGNPDSSLGIGYTLTCTAFPRAPDGPREKWCSINAY